MIDTYIEDMRNSCGFAEDELAYIRERMAYYALDALHSKAVAEEALEISSDTAYREKYEG